MPEPDLVVVDSVDDEPEVEPEEELPDDVPPPAIGEADGVGVDDEGAEVGVGVWD